MFVSVTVSVMGFVPVVTMWCRWTVKDREDSEQKQEDHDEGG